jgi:hypothetical protein
VERKKIYTLDRSRGIRTLKEQVDPDRPCTDEGGSSACLPIQDKTIVLSAVGIRAFMIFLFKTVTEPLKKLSKASVEIRKEQTSK